MDFDPTLKKKKKKKVVLEDEDGVEAATEGMDELNVDDDGFGEKKKKKKSKDKDKDADPEEEKKPENVIPRIRAMVGDRDFGIDWVSVYTFQCRRMQRFVHDRVIFVGDSAHIVSPFRTAASFQPRLSTSWMPPLPPRAPM